MLRFVTYLAPSIPRRFFEIVAREVAASLGVEATLRVDSRRLLKLAEAGQDGRFFRSVRRSGSHLNSIRLVAAKRADGAAIDSNVLAYWLSREPRWRESIRVIESWGPYPIQPVVARRTLQPDLRNRIVSALLGLADDLRTKRALARFGVEGFVPISDAHYEAERAALRTCGGLFRTPVGPQPRDSRRRLSVPGAPPMADEELEGPLGETLA